jgi:CBS domain-containing protein
MSLKDSKSQVLVELVQTPLWDLQDELKGREVITINKYDTAAQAMRTLCDNNILSAPVVDENGRYMGMMDMMTIMSLSLDLFNEVFRPNRFSDEYLAKKRVFRNTTVADMLSKSLENTNQFCLHEDYSLFHALELMVISKKRRLAVVDSNNYVTGFVRCTSVCLFLFMDLNLYLL